MTFAIERSRAQRVVVRRDAPNVKLHVERGLSVSEADRRSFPDRAIFLDGVFAGPPFIDNVRRQYALDHHRGVLRPFTLATCEQAAVMVALGLPLEEEAWHIYINEPDLDALLAAWVLLRHDSLVGTNHAPIRRVMPLLRVEGNIDTHGFELPALAGMTPRRYGIERRRIEQLRRGEIALRRSGKWSRHDWLGYACATLNAFDRQLLPRAARRPHPHPMAVPSERRVAVLIRSSLGIYEVEQALRIRFGESLGRIVLDRGDHRVTVMQCDPFLSHGLQDLYPLLDAADRNALLVPGDGWGGSREIGGSPRQRGTALSGADVLRLAARLDGLEEIALTSVRSSRHATRGSATRAAHAG